MQATPIYRWGLGFIALRWRHVFWLLPLLGALLGFGLQDWKLYGPTATGFIQVTFFGISSVRTTPAEVTKLLQSDELLSKTEDSLDLSRRWSTDPSACVARLRSMIRSEVVSGTSLVELHVSNPNRSEAIEIWNTHARLATQLFLDANQAAEDAKRAAEEATLEALEIDLKEKQHKLASALTHRASPTNGPDQDSEELAQLRADFEAAEKAYDKEFRGAIPSYIACGVSIDPIAVHEAPAAFSLNRWDSIRPLLHHAGLGISIGVILTAPVAYLLEFLRPRRRLEIELET